MTATTIEAAAGAIPAAPTPASTDPDWCTFRQSGPCLPDRYDSSRFHMSTPVDVPTALGTGLLDVSLIRLDDEAGTGQTEVSVNVGQGGGKTVELTPEQAMHLIEVVRGHALRAAYPSGVEVPADRVRVGDELLTPNGWQTVEIVDVDGWLTTGHPKAVSINTDAHEEDDEAYRFPIGHMVRVRKQVP